MKTAVVYARYSSDKQTEQSIEGQLRTCQEYALRNNIVIVHNYIDRAMTGTNDNRKEFQQMLHDATKHEWDFVLVYKLDRFSRNKYESVIHKKHLRDNGVTVISAMENIPETPEGIILESLLEGMNQYYSAELAQKVRRGFHESWLKGNATGGKPLFGYNVVNKKYVINEHEKRLVIRIFSQYARGFKAREIAEMLNDQGFCRPSGQEFTEKFIITVLHNSRYTGLVTHNGIVYDKIFPRIIDDDLWRAVSVINEQNKLTGNNKKPVYNYLLTGKLICGLCNHKMSGESGTSQTGNIYHYYVCPKHRYKNNPCSTKAVSKELIENTVITAIQKLISKEENIKFIANKMYYLLQKRNENNPSLMIWEQRKAEIEKSIANIVKAIEQGIISEYTQSRLAELELELVNIETDINKEKHKNLADITPEMIADFLRSNMPTNLKHIKVRKTLINNLLREVRLYNKKVVLVFNIAEKLITPEVELTVNENIKHEEKLKKAITNNQAENSDVFFTDRNFGLTTMIQKNE